MTRPSLPLHARFLFHSDYSLIHVSFFSFSLSLSHACLTAFAVLACSNLWLHKTPWKKIGINPKQKSSSRGDRIKVILSTFLFWSICNHIVSTNSNIFLWWREIFLNLFTNDWFPYLILLSVSTFLKGERVRGELALPIITGFFNRLQYIYRFDHCSVLVCQCHPWVLWLL